MKLFACLSLLFPLSASAHELAPLNEPELATVLGLFEELAATPPSSDQPYVVRVFAAPTGVYECGGTVASCPDVRLLITVSHGDLGETPALYELPAQKGWEFKGWGSPAAPGDRASFTVQTALPGANIEPEDRLAWHPQLYQVFVSPESASYVYD